MVNEEKNRQRCVTGVCEYPVAPGLKPTSRASSIERSQDERLVKMHWEGKERRAVTIERDKGRNEALCWGSR